ncbi:glycerol-3-phosphate dehydrogenase/oxidase [Planomicrobium sp. CPCC 101079]|uniref:glycerol-3-phosphate dehydrogenase/oxidase n=1 Tax=Planomicrobium sp. CPCC 101079 TaxID=2599618 RepID=UPI0011B43FC6|nr:glycerol-3-phosphate dehydrogenase/oxidase [Planomicrobium sp. CPCC 101079]TWT04532.1 glycerol-3-phosphate dehydrogenase/oxidase [Planomicrobium sp. CPCC 101079]
MFSAKRRLQQVAHLSNHQYDIVIIGGGITGAGMALDATSRGLSVALIEMQDFAAGTSSRSTKLVHGGLRYLKNFQVKIVAEVGREREIVYENAVHVTEPKKMLLPFYKGGTFGPVFMNIGLRAYDILANVKKAERRTMLEPAETLHKEPLLKRDGLVGGGYYVEYRTDDARLTLETMKKAAELGAVCLNYVKAEGFIYNTDGKVGGVQATDLVDGTQMDIFAKKVINATGAWVDNVQDFDAETPEKEMRLTKGVHIVVDQKTFPLSQAVYFDTPDKRMVFAIPRDTKVYVGTTDDFYDEDPISPAADKKDVDYLIQAVRRTFPSVQLTSDDVESTWAGVRPLIYESGKDPSDISRKDEIWISDSGLISIAGGKLTGYRKMAETTMDRVVKLLKRETGSKYGKSVTKNLPLSGGDFGGSKNFAEFVHNMAVQAPQYGLSPEEGRLYAQFFGTNAKKVFHFYRGLPDNVPGGIPKTLAAVVEYAIEEEMARTPSDFFIRRTGDLYFHIQDVVRYQDGVLEYMSKALKYTPEQKEAYRQELLAEIEQATRYGRKVLE